MSLAINHECIRAPVTALAFCDRILFGAEGPFLHVLDHESSELIVSHQIFQKQAIHGILVCSQSGSSVVILIHGGCYVRLVRLYFSKLDSPRDILSKEKPVLHTSSIVKCTDWILDLSLAPSEGATFSSLVERQSVAAITAHNALLRLKLEYGRLSAATNTSSSLVILLDELTASSRSILYSAHILWTSASHILIAAGTAFGEILVWSWSESLGSSSSAQLHHVFSGHEGSVFGVRISETLTSGHMNGAKRLLASCSDDRSIRIWNISELPVIKSLESLTENDEAVQIRETGFGANLETEDQSIQLCLAIGWAHASRVWTVEFLAPDCIEGRRTDIVQVISTGEDATSRVWDLVANENHTGEFHTTALPLTLREVGTAAFHTGKNLWSLALQYSSGKLRKIATGAADSMIITHFPITIHSSTTSHGDFHEARSIEDVFGSAQSSRKPDIFRSYSFIDRSTYLLTTNEGRITIKQIEGNDSPVRSSEEQDSSPQDAVTSISPFFDASQLHDGQIRTATSSFRHIPTLKGYSVSAGLVSRRISFFAGATGDVYAMTKISSPYQIYSASRKVGGLFPHGSPDGTNGDCHLLVTLIGASTADLLLLALSEAEIHPIEARINNSLPHPTSDESSAKHLAVVGKVVLKLPEASSFVVTSMVVAQSEGRIVFVFVGARSGMVALYKLSTCQKDSESDSDLQATLITLTDHVHGKEAVTSMLWRPSKDVDFSSSIGFLITVGRDSACAAYEVNLLSGEFRRVHTTSLPFGPNIEGVYIQDERLMVYGFRSTQFVLFDERNEKEIMTVDCGGAHRNWAFDPNSSGPGGTLVWTQASKLKVCHRAIPSYQVLRSGGHGREIKAVAVSPIMSDNNGGLIQLIATGAEDTDIKIFEYTSDQSTPKSARSFQCLRTLRKHTTGIQHLAWSDNGKYLYSSGGCEEFFVWRIHMLPIIGVGVVCEAVLESESDVPDLRIMSFSVRNLHIENDFDSWTDSTISMVYSDSTIRVCSYTPSSPNKWMLIYTGTYLTSCLTQCIFLSPTTLLTSGTDGHIAFWDTLSDPNTHTSRTKIHQNTTKTLAYQHLSASTTFLFTGGDDGALGFTLIRVSADSASPDVSTLLLPRAHAAAITACAFLPRRIQAAAMPESPPVTDMQLVTSGTDQRVILWFIQADVSKPGVEGIEVRKAGRVDTAVADVSDLAILDAEGEDGVGVVVCGVGMQVFRVVSDVL